MTTVKAMNKTTHILAIETSCDETAAAVVADGTYVKSNIIFSQIPIHQKFGGVVPEVASRKHIEHIQQVVEEALLAAGLSFQEIDGIAVTKGPGLIGALLVGVSYAKGLSYAIDKPLIGVNHLYGHISANFLTHPQLKPPFLCLVVSGGHTHLLEVADMYTMKMIGRTRDDAAGEAFDKVARALSLPYPGGPQIDKLSQEGDEESISFPVSYLKDGGYDFSFSGLKSAVLNYLNQANQKGIMVSKEDVAASFQQAAIKQLVSVTERALLEYRKMPLVLAGGVCANRKLRASFGLLCEEHKVPLYYPESQYCTDNAAMIGAYGYHLYLKKDFCTLDLNPAANIESFTGF